MAPGTRTCLILAALLLVTSAHPASAQQSNRSVQYVSVGVRPIIALAVSPVDTPFADRNDQARRSTVAHATWAMSANVSGLGLVARLDSPMPDGLHLEISAVSGLGVGGRSVRISSADEVAVVSSIGRGREKRAPIELEVVGDAAILGMTHTRTVTFTLMDPASGVSDSVSRTIHFGAGPGLALAEAR